MGSLTGRAGGDLTEEGEGEHEPNVDQAYAELGMKAHPRDSGARDSVSDASSAGARAGTDAWRGGSAGTDPGSSHAASGRGGPGEGLAGEGEGSLGHRSEEGALRDPMGKEANSRGSEGRASPLDEREKPIGAEHSKQEGAGEGPPSGSGKEEGDASFIGWMGTSHSSAPAAPGGPGSALLAPTGVPDGNQPASTITTFSAEGGAVFNGSSPGPQVSGNSVQEGPPQQQQQQGGKPMGRRRLLSKPEQGTGGRASGSVLKGGDVVQETQKRQPLVYIYELPPEFNTHLLQVCLLPFFHSGGYLEDNGTARSSWVATCEG